jgi:hypothetical protein
VLDVVPEHRGNSVLPVNYSIPCVVDELVDVAGRNINPPAIVPARVDQIERRDCWLIPVQRSDIKLCARGPRESILRPIQSFKEDSSAQQPERVENNKNGRPCVGQDREPETRVAEHGEDEEDSF